MSSEEEKSKVRRVNWVAFAVLSLIGLGVTSVAESFCVQYGLPFNPFGFNVLYMLYALMFVAFFILAYLKK